MTQFSIFKSFIFTLVCFSLFSCNSDDNSDNEYYSKFQVSNKGVQYPINDYHAFLNTDSTFVMSSFSAKVPVLGLEDEIEDVYTKYNLSVTLSKFEEGEYSFIAEDAIFTVDTLFYSYSSTPYRKGSLVLEVKNLDPNSSFLYLKQIIGGRDLVSGNFNITELLDTAKPPLDSNITSQISGDFLNIPFTKK